MRLSLHQHELLQKHGIRVTVKFCNRCGGKHAGLCNLVATSHGTRCRPELLDTIEQRFRDRRVTA